VTETLLRTEFPRDRSCAAAARRAIESAAGDLLSASALDDLKLVATELVDNAYLHGRGQIGLVLRRREDRLLLEVIDQGSGQAIKIREEAPDGGWGLRILDQIAERWGAYEGTTHVWAEIPIG
jgi:anti-sigma regulatory factor (Ser/Thr protein kinase)